MPTINALRPPIAVHSPTSPGGTPCPVMSAPTPVARTKKNPPGGPRRNAELTKVPATATTDINTTRASCHQCDPPAASRVWMNSPVNPPANAASTSDSAAAPITRSRRR